MLKRTLISPIIIAVIFLIMIAGIGSIQPAEAQAGLQGWNLPVNVSRSRAASQPRIVASPNGLLQVFWIDRIDGLVTSVFNGTTWSSPAPAPLSSALASTSIQGIMPTLVADAIGQVHAFWQENTGKAFPVSTLYHSKMPIGSTIWATPQQVAEDAVAYDVTAPTSGGITLAYIRRLNNEIAPSGIFIRKLDSTSNFWGPATLINSSIYYRLLNQGDINLRIADDGLRNVLLAWEDPFLGSSFIAISKDGGSGWSAPELIGDPQLNPQDPRVTAMPGFALGMWETTTFGRCALYQQQLSTPISGLVLAPTLAQATATLPAGKTPAVPSLQTSTPIPDQTTATWSNPIPIFPDLQNCPSSDQFWPQPRTNQIFWLWGLGSSKISLAAWDVNKGVWSTPTNFSFTFEDPTTAELVILGDLHATLGSSEMAVTGIDINADVWVTTSQSAITDMTYAPPSPWTSAQQVSSPTTTAIDQAITMDGQGRAHLVWIEPATTGTLGASIKYGSWDSTAPISEQLLDDTYTLYPGNPEELARQPSLLADLQAGLVHLVWSGGQDGDILYTHAAADQANSRGDWQPVQTLSITPFASLPQIGIDALGRLSLVYIVQINEDRGVYLTHSENRGDKWSIAERIVDTTITGAQAIDHPALAVSPQGDLHLVWVETSPSGSGAPKGIFYTTSKDGGKTWNTPVVAAGPGNDWPELILSDNQLHIFYAQVTQQNKEGEIWHRQLNLAVDGDKNWTPAERIPGWQTASLPYGVTIEGAPGDETIHLVAVDPDSGTISYSTWKDNIWTKPESFFPTATQLPGIGLQAATRPEGGYLAVAWLAQDDLKASNTVGLYFAARKISTSDVPLLPTLAPTTTPTLAVTPTETVFVRTPTPNLNRVPAPTNTSVSPLLVGGALAAVLTAVFLLWRSMSERIRSKLKR